MASRGRDTEAEEQQRVILTDMLRLAVPFHMAELEHLHPEFLSRISSAEGLRVAYLGEYLMFESKKPGRAADAFGRLARGIAAAALVGSVDVYGLHWCRRHGGTPSENGCATSSSAQ